MASIKLSAMFADIRGKLAGNYFAKRKNTIILAVCGSKLTRADSGRQTLQNSRNNLALISRGWQQLAEASQIAWNASASLETWYTKVGIPYSPSGYQVYTQRNSNLKKIGAAPIVIPVVTDNVDDIRNVHVGFNALLALEYSYTGVLGAKSQVVISASYPNSLGTSYAKGGLKQIFISPAADVGPTSLVAAYTSVFGTAPVAGMVYFKAEIIDNSSGIMNGSKLTRADSGKTTIYS